MQQITEIRNFTFNLVINLIGINCSFLAAFFFSFIDVLREQDASFLNIYKTLFVVANLLFLVINLIPKNNYKKEFKNYSFFLIGYLGLIVLIQGYEFSRAFHVYFLSLLFAFTVILRFSNSIQLLEKYLLSKGSERKVILIGEDFDSTIVQYINSRPGNFKCIGLLSDYIPQQNTMVDLYKGNIRQIEELLSKESIDEALISSSTLSVTELNIIIKTTEKYHATASILPPYFHFLTKQSCHTEYWMGVPIISVFHSKLALRSSRIAKRVLDVCVSLFFLTAVFPILFLIVAPAIWLSNKGPIFFKQLRKGYKQEPFFCYKFRTMKLNTGIEEAVQARREDPRITAIGKSLRKTSIDEVPQFINVLFGNMSVVGPRPHMVEHDEMYEKVINRYNTRFVTKPGITGWAQLKGLRGETGDTNLMQKRVEHDLWYIKHWSLWLDIKIIALTAVKLLFKGDSNAY